MDSRSYILDRIKKNKPSLSPLPTIPAFERHDIDLVAHFKEVLSFVGGRPIELLPGTDINEEIHRIYPDMKAICATTPMTRLGNIDIHSIGDAHQLADIDLVIMEGVFGVAENAAIWIPAQTSVIRALPFITQHMVLILKKSDLVWNMHEALLKIDLSAMGGYGVFISGPSKTADIEQSLVIGAHGSRSLVVFLID